MVARPVIRGRLQSVMTTSDLGVDKRHLESIMSVKPTAGAVQGCPVLLVARRCVRAKRRLGHCRRLVGQNLAEASCSRRRRLCGRCPWRRGSAPRAAQDGEKIICYNARVKLCRPQKEISMDSTRKATREDNETTLQYQSPQEARLVEERNQEQLVQLEDSISRRKQTPDGSAELQRRIKLFGECIRIDGETSGQFYIPLRHWLDRDLPRKSSPFHAPRQTGD